MDLIRRRAEEVRHITHTQHKQPILVWLQFQLSTISGEDKEEKILTLTSVLLVSLAKSSQANVRHTMRQGYDICLVKCKSNNIVYLMRRSFLAVVHL